MRLHISIGLDDGEKFGDPFIVPTRAGDIVLTAERGSCIVDVDPGTRELVGPHDGCEVEVRLKAAPAATAANG